MSKIFFDANIIVYANDPRDRRKQETAIEQLESSLSQGNGVISTQVLKEYSSVALTKLRHQVEDVDRQLVLLCDYQIVQVNVSLIRNALNATARHQISFWDSLILAAASEAQCEIVLSEDLNDGQIYDGVRVTNPFKQP